jgi:hypothetical protein
MEMQQPKAALDPSLPEQQPMMSMAKFALITHGPTLFNAVLVIPAGFRSDALRHSTPFSVPPIEATIFSAHFVSETLTTAR